MDVSGSGGSGNNAEWFRWAISSILGFFAAIYGGALLRLFTTTERLRDRVDNANELARTAASVGDHAIWEAIDKLRDVVELNQREAASDRRHIAENMLTRLELQAHESREFTALKEQTDRIIEMIKQIGGSG